MDLWILFDDVEEVALYKHWLISIATKRVATVRIYFSKSDNALSLVPL